MGTTGPTAENLTAAGINVVPAFTLTEPIPTINTPNYETLFFNLSYPFSFALDEPIPTFDATMTEIVAPSLIAPYQAPKLSPRLSRVSQGSFFTSPSTWKSHLLQDPGSFGVTNDTLPIEYQLPALPMLPVEPPKLAKPESVVPADPKLKKKTFKNGEPPATILEDTSVVAAPTCSKPHHTYKPAIELEIPAVATLIAADATPEPNARHIRKCTAAAELLDQ